MQSALWREGRCATVVSASHDPSGSALKKPTMMPRLPYLTSWLATTPRARKQKGDSKEEGINVGEPKHALDSGRMVLGMLSANCGGGVDEVQAMFVYPQKQVQLELELRSRVVVMHTH